MSDRLRYEEEYHDYTVVIEASTVGELEQLYERLIVEDDE